MDFSEVLEANNVDEAFLKFNNIVYSLYDDCYPLVSKTIVNKRNDTPWMTAAIKQSIKTKNKLYKKFVKKPITYGAIYRKYRNSLTKIIKTSKNRYYHKKFNDVKGNIKQTWKILNNMLGKNHYSQNNIFNVEGNVSTNPEIISNAFNEYFANAATQVVDNLPAAEVPFESYLQNQVYPIIEWSPVTELEIKSIVKKCNKTKPGPDEIPINVIKNNIDVYFSNSCSSD